jgi:hypothetical protein
VSFPQPSGSWWNLEASPTQVDDIVRRAREIASGRSGSRVPFSHPPAMYYDVGRIRMVYQQREHEMVILQFIRL